MNLDPKIVLREYARNAGDNEIRHAVWALNDEALTSLLGRIGEYFAQWGSPSSTRVATVASLGLLLRDIEESLLESRWVVGGAVEEAISRLVPDAEMPVREALRVDENYKMALEILLAREPAG